VPEFMMDPGPADVGIDISYRARKGGVSILLVPFCAPSRLNL
jgi:hypothetical protein